MLITETQLREWSNYKRREALETWLKSNRIPFFTGKDGCICTTSEAINGCLFNPNTSPAAQVDVEFM